VVQADKLDGLGVGKFFDYLCGVLNVFLNAIISFRLFFRKLLRLPLHTPDVDFVGTISRSEM